MLANHREVLAMVPTSNTTTGYGKHGLSGEFTCLFRLNSRATVVPPGFFFLSTNSNQNQTWLKAL